MAKGNWDRGKRNAGLEHNLLKAEHENCSFKRNPIQLIPPDYQYRSHSSLNKSAPPHTLSIYIYIYNIYVHICLRSMCLSLSFVLLSSDFHCSWDFARNVRSSLRMMMVHRVSKVKVAPKPKCLASQSAFAHTFCQTATESFIATH